MISLRRHEAPPLTLGRRRNNASSSRGRHERLPSIDDIDVDTTAIHVTIGTNNSNNDSNSSSRNDAHGDIEADNNHGFEVDHETTELTSNSSHVQFNNRTGASDDAPSPSRSSQTLHRIQNQNVSSSSVPSSSPATSTTEPAQATQAAQTRSSAEDSEIVVSPPDTDNLQTRLQAQLDCLTEQSEMYKHSTQTWTVIISLLLIRIWLEAIISADIGLMSISLVCTSYFFRWKQYRALQVQRFDERIEYLTQLTDDNHDDERNTTMDEDDEEVGLSERTRRTRRWRRQNRGTSRLRMEFSRDDHVDFEMLSFQAQLALALMESQQMMQNGVNSDRQNEESRGVSDETKERWHSFEFTNEEDFHSLVQKNLKWNDRVHGKSANSGSGSSVSGSKNGDYLGVKSKDSEEEAPSCCICLCEYEEGEKMVQLPCGHVFHSDCIDSWTQNHSTCPLCNAELEGPANNDSAEREDN